VYTVPWTAMYTRVRGGPFESSVYSPVHGGVYRLSYVCWIHGPQKQGRCASIAHCRVHQPSRPGCDTRIPSHCLQSTSIDMTSAQAPILLACVCGMPSDAYACSIPCAVNACWQQPGGHMTHPGASTTAKQRLHSAPPTPCYPPLSRHGLRAQGIAACT
jgi:hypothetical protein